MSLLRPAITWRMDTTPDQQTPTWLDVSGLVLKAVPRWGCNTRYSPYGPEFDTLKGRLELEADPVLDAFIPGRVYRCEMSVTLGGEQLMGWASDAVPDYVVLGAGATRTFTLRNEDFTQLYRAVPDVVTSADSWTFADVADALASGSVLGMELDCTSDVQAGRIIADDRIRDWSQWLNLFGECAGGWVGSKRRGGMLFISASAAAEKLRTSLFELPVIGRQHGLRAKGSTLRTNPKSVRTTAQYGWYDSSDAKHDGTIYDIKEAVREWGEIRADLPAWFPEDIPQLASHLIPWQIFRSTPLRLVSLRIPLYQQATKPLEDVISLTQPGRVAYAITPGATEFYQPFVVLEGELAQGFDAAPMLIVRGVDPRTRNERTYGPLTPPPGTPITARVWDITLDASTPTSLTVTYWLSADSGTLYTRHRKGSTGTWAWESETVTTSRVTKTYSTLSPDSFYQFEATMSADKSNSFRADFTTKASPGQDVSGACTVTFPPTHGIVDSDHTIRETGPGRGRDLIPRDLCYTGSGYLVSDAYIATDSGTEKMYARLHLMTLEGGFSLFSNKKQRQYTVDSVPYTPISGYTGRELKILGVDRAPTTNQYYVVLQDDQRDSSARTVTWTRTLGTYDTSTSTWTPDNANKRSIVLTAGVSKARDSVAILDIAGDSTSIYLLEAHWGSPSADDYSKRTYQLRRVPKGDFDASGTLALLTPTQTGMDGYNFADQRVLGVTIYDATRLLIVVRTATKLIAYTAPKTFTNNLTLTKLWEISTGLPVLDQAASGVGVAPDAIIVNGSAVTGVYGAMAYDKADGTLRQCGTLPDPPRLRYVSWDRVGFDPDTVNYGTVTHYVSLNDPGYGTLRLRTTGEPDGVSVSFNTTKVGTNTATISSNGQDITGVKSGDKFRVEVTVSDGSTSVVYVWSNLVYKIRTITYSPPPPPPGQPTPPPTEYPITYKDDLNPPSYVRLTATYDGRTEPFTVPQTSYSGMAENIPHTDYLWPLPLLIGTDNASVTFDIAVPSGYTAHFQVLGTHAAAAFAGGAVMGATLGAGGAVVAANGLLAAGATQIATLAGAVSGSVVSSGAAVGTFFSSWLGFIGSSMINLVTLLSIGVLGDELRTAVEESRFESPPLTQHIKRPATVHPADYQQGSLSVVVQHDTSNAVFTYGVLGVFGGVSSYG